MPRYLIIRAFEIDEAEMPVFGRRSRELVDNELPEITWEHSYVVVDGEGNVMTYCIYGAPKHRARCGTSPPPQPGRASRSSGPGEHHDQDRKVLERAASRSTRLSSALLVGPVQVLEHQQVQTVTHQA